ncbi:MAG: dihydroxyacetone kinase subunit DhaK, partial [Mesorhizobium sp.]
MPVQTKKIINDGNRSVDEMLEGILAAHPRHLRSVDGSPRSIIARDGPRQGKVGLVIGGGSGHEPLHGGLVGHGMLDAACPGQVFTSPTPDQMLAAAGAVDTGAGCLFIVKNYEGDVMNFDMAAEMSEGVLQVVTNDDVAVENSSYTTGRRGVAGTLFVHKIAGHLSETGRDLVSVAAAARAAAKDIFSLGISLSSCSIPGQAHEDRFGAEDGELG